MRTVSALGYIGWTVRDRIGHGGGSGRVGRSDNDDRVRRSALHIGRKALMSYKRSESVGIGGRRSCRFEVNEGAAMEEGK